MPELPEVETIVRGLQTRVAGDRIRSVWIGSRKQPLKSSAAKISSTLTGKRILRVHRMGTHILFDLAGQISAVRAHEAQCIVHLGMTGRMLVCEPEAEAVKHTHLLASL